MVKGGTDMKNMKYILIAVAAMASAACAKEITPEPEQTPEVNLVPMTFTASADDGQDTKVFYDRETKTTQWKKGDKIMVISSTGTAREFEATSVTDNGKTATFEGLTENAETYYAVSPASAYKGDGQEVTSGTLYVNIPEVQTAVAGTFDPAAFVSVAKNDGGHLGFKNSCSIVRFNLKNPEGVKSVRFTANDVSNLAGTQNVLTSNIPSHSWGSAFDGRTSHDMITLNAPAEGFKAGTDYYMTMRPQTMAKGINLYIEYADAVKVRKGTSEFPAPMNTIRDLKTLDEVTLEDITPYDSYQMGFDMVIDGKVYNQAADGKAVLITASEASTSVYNQLNNGGIYFLQTSGEGSFNLHSNVAVSKDVVLIGNTDGSKVTVDFNGKNVNHAAGSIVLKNITLDVDAHTNYVFANNNATADVEAFVLDNCAVAGLVKPLYYVNVVGYTCKNITLKDTDVQLGAATNIIDLSKTTSLGNKTVNIENCIFYAASNTVSRIVNNSQNLSEYTADVRIENNTIFNLHAGTNNGLIHMAGAKSVVFRNNLVNFYSLNATEYVIRIWKNTPSYTVENNHFWARAASGIPADLTFYGDTKVSAADAAITSGSYPYASTVSGAGATR